MGANSMRIYLQLGQVMVSPTQPRQRTLTALARLLALAQSDGIYLDITGDLVWQPDRRTRVVRDDAHGASAGGASAILEGGRARRRQLTRGALLRADLRADRLPDSRLLLRTNRPLVVRAKHRHGHGPGRRRAWPAPGPDCLRPRCAPKIDRPVSIGLLPLTSGPFAPANVADLLDMLIVHEYPSSGQAPARHFADPFLRSLPQARAARRDIHRSQTTHPPKGSSSPAPPHTSPAHSNSSTDATRRPANLTASTTPCTNRASGSSSTYVASYLRADDGRRLVTGCEPVVTAEPQGSAR